MILFLDVFFSVCEELRQLQHDGFGVVGLFLNLLKSFCLNKYPLIIKCFLVTMQEIASLFFMTKWSVTMKRNICSVLMIVMVFTLITGCKFNVTTKNTTDGLNIQGDVNLQEDMEKVGDYLSSAESYFKTAEQDQQKQNFNDAISNYKKGLTIDPQNVDGYIKLAISYDAIGDSKEAEHAFKQAAALSKENKEIFLLIANYYNNKGDFKNALDYYDKITQVDPEDVNAFISVANAHYNLNEYNMAIKAYEKALKINPDNPVIYNNLGNTYFKMEEYGKAADNFQQALTYDPNNSNAKEMIQVINEKQT